MRQKPFLMLFALVLSVTAVAQETIFPAKFTAPFEFNTGKVHISVLSRSEHQMTTNFLFERGSRKVKRLKLPTMQPLDPETMKLIFNKQR